MAAGSSSINQWPEFGITSSVTVNGGVAHHDRLVGTEGLLATDRKDRHGELRGHRRQVFLSILPDGAKLSESRMHRAWQGVELGIVLPRRLVDLRRIAGELIPETVEIDTLTSRHETLHVRPAEIEMPEQRAAHDLVPRRNSGDWCIHHHQFLGLVGIAGRIGIGDHGSDVVPDDRRMIEAELHQDRTDVGGLRALVIAALRVGRQTYATQVRDHDRVISRKIGRQRRPHVAGVTEAMKQHDRRTLAANADMDRRAVGLHILRAERRRKAFHLRHRRQRHGERPKSADHDPEHLTSPAIRSPVGVRASLSSPPGQGTHSICRSCPAPRILVLGNRPPCGA